MKKIKVSLSMIVMLLASGVVAWAAVSSINSVGNGDHTLVSNIENISIVSSTSALSHTFKWKGALPVSKGGTGMQSFTTGSILFYSSGASISQDNSNLFWNSATKRLAIGASTPSSEVNVNGTVEATQVSTNYIVASGSNQSLSLDPTGTDGRVFVGGQSLVVARLTSEPASTSTGQIYFDRDTKTFKGHNGIAWVNLSDPPTGLTDSLVSYWKFDESSGNATDSHGANNLTDNNTVARSAGGIFSNNYAVFAEANTEWFSDGNVIDNPSTLSISVWIKGSDTTGVQMLVSKVGDIDPGDPGWALEVNRFGAGVIDFALQQNGTDKFQYRKNTTAVLDGNWHHIVGTWDGTFGSTSGMHVYVDGSITGDAQAQIGAATMTMFTNANNLLVGRQTASGTPYYLNQSLDELGIWTIELTSSEVNSLYNSGSGLPLSQF